MTEPMQVQLIRVLKVIARREDNKGESEEKRTRLLPLAQ